MRVSSSPGNMEIVLLYTIYKLIEFYMGKESHIEKDSGT